MSTLRHQHLPKLEETGMIEYDDGSGDLWYDGDSLLETHLEPTRNVDLPR